MSYYESDGLVYQITGTGVGTKLTKKEGKARYRQQALDKLRGHLRPGQVVYTLVRHVSRSGMQRQISLYTLEGREIVNLDWLVSIALDLPCKDGIVVNGCGMDMGFHLVYELGQALWPDGTPEPHGTRNGKPDSVGGYALKHRWL